MKNYILITGASSGVGRETAIRLSRKNNLVLNGRNQERLLETKSLCSSENEIVIWQRDLSNVDDLENDLPTMLKTNDLIIESFVHCAGILHMLPVRSVSKDILLETYSLHVFAPELITKVLSSRKYNQNALKSVVFISSNISERGASAFSVYGSSKSAMDGLARNLAIELAPKVRVNSILPGGMPTRMTEELLKNDSNYPLGLGKPSYIAPMVEFLLSDDAQWITGQQITIDGGRTVDITENRYA